MSRNAMQWVFTPFNDWRGHDGNFVLFDLTFSLGSSICTVGVIVLGLGFNVLGFRRGGDR